MILNTDLTGKVALVGGSTQGIGRAAAELLAGHGAQVFLLARNAGELKAAAAALPSPNGVKHGWLQADFADLASVESALSSFHAPVNILVNNTGGPPSGPILLADTDDFTTAFSAHVLVNQMLMQKLLPGMKETGYGRIINVISTSVKVPLAGLGVSNTIRAAVANWAKTLANELAADGITVNNVLPGATLTARLQSIFERNAAKRGTTVEEEAERMRKEVPMGRFASAEEVAGAILYLASPAAAYITGINVPVDGGRLGCL
jgi:3-oxoacyl-[acyl-carrier protein] reductase